MNFKKSVYLCISFTLLLFTQYKPVFAINDKPVTVEKKSKDTIVIEKKLVDKKKYTRLYYNHEQDVIFFAAKGEQGRVYHLYLFDIDGNVTKEAKIRNNETTVLRNLDKGTYVYEIFIDDDRLENGQILIR